MYTYQTYGQNGENVYTNKIDMVTLCNDVNKATVCAMRLENVNNDMNRHDPKMDPTTTRKLVVYVCDNRFSGVWPRFHELVGPPDWQQHHPPT